MGRLVLVLFAISRPEESQGPGGSADREGVDGDKNADVVLKPGNVVSIRQLAGWQDIGASVTITGEVEHAGSYGIEQGERLSSVLKRAGGFRVDAYRPPPSWSACRYANWVSRPASR